MTRADLTAAIVDKGSFLCVGLDTDVSRIPAHLASEPDPIFAFNKAIIDATHRHCVAYKPNIAFYEAMGPKGWESLERTMDYIPEGIFTIADAKRGDIGNTSAKYAQCFFEYFDFDAVTVAPYMGIDSVGPFLEWDDKWVILLGLTSNAGSRDFQMLQSDQRYLYEHVLTKAQEWGSTDQLMFVVGATHPERFADIRQIVPDHFLLVPGVGAQGGDLDAVIKHGANAHCGLLINSSRGIIYAGDEADFASAAGNAAESIARAMQPYL
jgi:orotidine-5'-phosphate decarboxylase